MPPWKSIPALSTSVRLLLRPWKPETVQNPKRKTGLACRCRLTRHYTVLYYMHGYTQKTIQKLHEANMAAITSALTPQHELGSKKSIPKSQVGRLGNNLCNPCIPVHDARSPFLHSVHSASPGRALNLQYSFFSCIAVGGMRRSEADGS